MTNCLGRADDQARIVPSATAAASTRRRRATRNHFVATIRQNSGGAFAPPSLGERQIRRIIYG
jgi:hypothetical protein